MRLSSQVAEPGVGDAGQRRRCDVSLQPQARQGRVHQQGTCIHIYDIPVDGLLSRRCWNAGTPQVLRRSVPHGGGAVAGRQGIRHVSQPRHTHHFKHKFI